MTPDATKLVERYCKARVLADDPRTPEAERLAARRYADKLSDKYPDLRLADAFERAKQETARRTQQPDIDIDAILRDPSRFMGDPELLNRAARVIFDAVQDPARTEARRTIFSQVMGSMTDSYLRWMGSRLAARADDIMEEILAGSGEEDDMADDDEGVEVDVERHARGIRVTLTGDADDIIGALREREPRREIIAAIGEALSDLDADDEEEDDDDSSSGDDPPRRRK